MGLLGNFYGHDVLAMISDLVLGVFSVIYVYGYFLVLKQTTSKLLRFAAATYVILSLPNAAYLFAEIRHIILIDSVADNHELIAIIVFTCSSCVGLICTMAAIMLTAREKTTNTVTVTLNIIFLSFLCSWGVLLGLCDLTSLAGFLFPPSVVMITLILLKSTEAIYLCIGLTIIFSGATLVANAFWNRISDA